MSGRMKAEDAISKVCPYMSTKDDKENCIADKCMKWHQLIPESSNTYGYCSIDVERLAKLERIESILTNF